MKPSAVFALVCTLALISGALADDRPNILFAIADDWGWPHAGALGDDVVRTPTFDRLAAEGAMFERAFVSSPSCTPSRNAVLTGQHFFRLGEGASLWSTLAPAHPVFPLLLEDAGYHVGHWRKAWGPGDWKALGRTRNPAGKRYGSFEAFLDARPDGDAPFCFWLGSSDPHRGYEAGSGAASGIAVDVIDVPPPYPDSPVIRNDIADYYFEVQRFDGDVGRALELLAQRGELENTLVVMTGDHGWPFPRGKTNLYDLGSRVPLVMRWPGHIDAGTRPRGLATLVDLAPTFLDAAGVAVPDVMTGLSMLPRLRGESPERTAVVLGRERHTSAQEHHDGGYPMRALRTLRFLYIRNDAPDDWPAGWEAPGRRPFRDCDNGPTKTFLLERRLEYPNAFELCFAKRPAEELYDVAADPWQLTNLAGDPAYDDDRRSLAAQLRQRCQRLGDLRALDRAEELVGQYRSGR